MEDNAHSADDRDRPDLGGEQKQNGYLALGAGWSRWPGQLEARSSGKLVTPGFGRSLVAQEDKWHKGSKMGISSQNRRVHTISDITWVGDSMNVHLIVFLCSLGQKWLLS
jgi:hypothetical protein